MKTTFQYDHYYTYSELTEALQTLVKTIRIYLRWNQSARVKRAATWGADADQ